MKIKNLFFSIFKKEEEIKMKNEKFSSEALKLGIEPNKPVEEMTPEEIQEFLSTIKPDKMGFDGKEGVSEC